jgi:hypothetical protein
MSRWPLHLMIPLNLLLVVWVWIGRIVFGVGGWFIVILLPVVAVLAILLLVTTILAHTQHGRPRALTRLQSRAQLATWAGMLGFGLFIPDFGDTDDSYLSFLSQVLGYSDAVMSASWVVTTAFAALTLVGYVVLLGALVAGRRRAPVLTPTG